MQLHFYVNIVKKTQLRGAFGLHRKKENNQEKENNQNPVANFSRRLYKKNKIFAGNIIF